MTENVLKVLTVETSNVIQFFQHVTGMMIAKPMKYVIRINAKDICPINVIMFNADLIKDVFKGTVNQFTQVFVTIIVIVGMDLSVIL